MKENDLGQTIQTAIGRGVAWGVLLLLMKVGYGFTQDVGLIDSIFSQNGLIVFAIGFAFGAWSSIEGD